MTLFFVKGRCQKGLVSQNLIFFKEFVMTLLASTRVFHKKSQLNFFVIFDVLFVDVRLFLDNGRFRGLPLDE